MRPGDIVYINDSAKVDVGFLAWNYVNTHRKAIIRHRFEHDDLPEREIVYALEFDAPFSGGVTCQGYCLPRQGQFITSKHLELAYEESREVQTIPG